MVDKSPAVGIFDRNRYYSKELDADDNRITIADSIHLDFELINQKISEGFDTSKLKTFLICGSHSVKSIEAMIRFIQQIKPGENSTLLVTDINKEAFDKLTEHPIEIPKNIKLELFQGDLIKLGLSDGVVDYARLDFTQNFIPADKQATMLRELNRVVSSHGMVVSVMEIMPKSVDIIDKLKRMTSKSKGSVIDEVPTFGYNQLIPTRELINLSATKANFRTTFLEDPKQLPYSNLKGETCLVVYEKPLKRQFFTPFKK